MREIKFRAWDEQINHMFMSDSSKHALLISFCGEVVDSVVPFTSQIKAHKDLILMQFTGLQDNNGKDIYEGDIVSCAQSLQVGVRNAGRGRNSYTYSINEDKTILGRIVFMDGSFHFISDDVIEYQSSFMRGCGNTKSQVQANYLRTFKHDLNRLLSKIKSSVVVVGNIYENPELLEKSS